MAKPVMINDVLEGHVALDLECLDRICLNAYVPNLQVGGPVASSLTAHLGTRPRLRRSSIRTGPGSGRRSGISPTKSASDNLVLQDRPQDRTDASLPGHPSRDEPVWSGCDRNASSELVMTTLNSGESRSGVYAGPLLKPRVLHLFSRFGTLGAYETVVS